VILWGGKNLVAMIGELADEFISWYINA
jgi:hypothetical protein